MFPQPTDPESQREAARIQAHHHLFLILQSELSTSCEKLNMFNLKAGSLFVSFMCQTSV